jgi:hypothetical protein
MPAAKLRPVDPKTTTRHVLAAMIANGFHNGRDAAIANTEALARCAATIGFAAGRAIESEIADNDVLLGDED